MRVHGPCLLLTAVLGDHAAAASLTQWDSSRCMPFVCSNTLRRCCSLTQWDSSWAISVACSNALRQCCSCWSGAGQPPTRPWRWTVWRATATRRRWQTWVVWCTSRAPACGCSGSTSMRSTQMEVSRKCVSCSRVDVGGEQGRGAKRGGGLRVTGWLRVWALCEEHRRWLMVWPCQKTKEAVMGLCCLQPQGSHWALFKSLSERNGCPA